MEYPPTVYASSKDDPDYFTQDTDCCHAVDVLKLPDHLADHFPVLPHVICHRTQRAFIGDEAREYMRHHMDTFTSAPEPQEPAEP